MTTFPTGTKTVLLYGIVASSKHIVGASYVCLNGKDDGPLWEAIA